MSAASTLGVVVASAIALCGCAGGADTEQSAPDGSTSTVAAPHSLEIPAVARPLDVSAVSNDPCALLDESQRRELGLPAVGEPGDTSDSTCDLYVDAGHKDESNYLRLVVFDEGGLDDQYKQCGTLDCSQWTVEAIGGYPVIRAVDEMTSKYGSCKLLLGVGDDAVIAIIDVRIDASADGSDCDRAVRAATMVLKTLA